MERFKFLFVLVCVLTLSACSSPPTKTTTPVTTQQPAVSPYPYPPPLPTILPTPASPYPIEGAEAEEVAWEDAKAMLLDGEVEAVFLFHNLTASMTLKDGRRVKTVQPAADEVLHVIQECGEKCADIRVATE